MNATATVILDHRNEVLLVGRVADEPHLTVLPSGDQLVTARLVVNRPPLAEPGHRARVDTITCTAWSVPLRRRLRGWSAGDVVEVTGALRRRFWRTETGPRSRYEVELASAVRLAAEPSASRSASGDPAAERRAEVETVSQQAVS